MPIPIFIVGKQRTETTWIGNILCQHSEITGIQAERHGGIHESVFFSHVINTSGDLHQRKNFSKFVEMFAKSDYFLLSSLSKYIFYEERPQTYHEFFRLLLDCFSEKQRKKFWVEKSPDHSLYMEDILGFYPDAKFIAIKRRAIDTIKSSLKLHYSRLPKTKIFLLFCQVFSYVLYYKHIEQFKKKHPDCILVVEYEDLKKSRDLVIRRLCSFLDIEFESQMMIQRYRPNTSYGSQQERKRVLTSNDVLFVNLFHDFHNALPFQLYRVVFYIYDYIFKSQLPDWFFSIEKEKKFEIPLDNVTQFQLRPRRVDTQ